MKGRCITLSGGARLCEHQQADGDQGVHQTLRLMRQLARRDARDERIIAAARRAAKAADTPLEMASRVFLWVAKTYPYASDPADREFVTAPIHTLTGDYYSEYPYRDCDDLATFYAALLKALGITSYLRAIAWRRHEYTHVYNIVRTGAGTYVPADLVMGKEGFGRERPKIIRSVAIEV